MPYWIGVKNENDQIQYFPELIQVGEWKGKRSNRVLVETSNGRFHVARFYETYGGENRVYIEEYYESPLYNVIRFMPIE